MCLTAQEDTEKLFDGRYRPHPVFNGNVSILLLSKKFVLGP